MGLPDRFEFYNKNNPEQFYFAIVNGEKVEISWNSVMTGKWNKTEAYSLSSVKEMVENGTWIITSDLNTTDSLRIGQVREALMNGKWVARHGWNGLGMYLFMIGVDHNDYWTYTNGKNDNYSLSPFVALKTSDDKVVPWTPSQSDFLAEDYYIVDNVNELSARQRFNAYEKFTFCMESGTIYVARKLDDRYIVMWNKHNNMDCTEYPVETVKELVEAGTWNVLHIEIE